MQCISIDSEWSKTYDFEEKNSKNLKSFQLQILSFRTFCLFSFKENTYSVAASGFTPPPRIYGYVRNY